MLIALVRHGSRCDNSDIPEERDRIEIKEDPPLTYLGRSQAHVAGKHLKDKL